MRAEDPEGVERGDIAMEWGSDALAELLGRLGLRYIALVPGSSYRGLHDSLVNYGGNRDPQMLVCLHEEHAVAIAHGYAKVTGRPMAVAIHSNVGLMHASMAIYNAYCDRVPMLIIGATGPVDAARRRPWIDWIHTSADQGALIRPYAKWDDQPASVEAALDSLARAYSITRPGAVRADLRLPRREPAGAAAARRRRRSPTSAGTARRGRTGPTPPRSRPRWSFSARRAARCSCSAGCSRDEQDWDRRVALAERYGALVISDLKNGAVFPTGHPLHPNPPGIFLPAASAAADRRRRPDRQPGLDRPGRDDRRGGRPRPPGVGPDHLLHDRLRAAQRLVQGFLRPRAGRPVRPRRSRPAGARAARIGRARSSRANGRPSARRPGRRCPAPAGDGSGIFMHDLAEALRGALAELASLPGQAPAGLERRRPRGGHPLDYLGMDGGAGIGSGPGMAVGAALALEGSGRLPVAVLGDGDFLMGGTAVWTAAHYRLPLLIVVANNSCFYNDVVHQERMAVQRQRPAGNSWIGQAITDPDPDLPALARSLGFHAADQVRDRAELPAALAAAVAAARSGQCVLVDVRVRPDGYAASGG